MGDLDDFEITISSRRKLELLNPRKYAINIGISALSFH